MGCGCGKKAGAASQSVGVARTSIYQVALPDGSIDSEHSSPVEARNRALAVSGRVRVTSREITPATS